jgi:hypothetical protein
MFIDYFVRTLNSFGRCHRWPLEAKPARRDGYLLLDAGGAGVETKRLVVEANWNEIRRSLNAIGWNGYLGEEQ